MDQALVSLLDLNGRLRSGSVKARDIIRQAVRALEAERAPGGPVRFILERESMDAARGVERELGRGRTRGILQGAPFGVSELLQVSGRAPFWDAAAQPRQMEDAAAVSRLRSAKAIPLALLAAPALGGPAFRPPGGGDPCAAVVGRGQLPFAIGLDFCGNVLLSALRHGCWALRPTFGTVSGFGTAPLSWTLAAVTAVAATPEDCGHVLSAMSGSDSRCSHSPGRTFRYAPQYTRPPQELPVADGGAPAAVRAVLEKSGVPVRAAAGPQGFPADIVEVTLAAEACEALEDELAASAEGREYWNQARELTAFDYLRAMRLRRALQDEYTEALAGAAAVVFSADCLTAAGAETGSNACRWLATALAVGAPLMVFGGAGQGFPGFCLTGRAGAENTILKLASIIREGFKPPGNS